MNSQDFTCECMCVLEEKALENQNLSQQQEGLRLDSRQ